MLKNPRRTTRCYGRVTYKINKNCYFILFSRKNKFCLETSIISLNESPSIVIDQLKTMCTEEIELSKSNSMYFNNIFLKEIYIFSDLDANKVDKALQVNKILYISLTYLFFEGTYNKSKPIHPTPSKIITKTSKFRQRPHKLKIRLESFHPGSGYPVSVI